MILTQLLYNKVDLTMGHSQDWQQLLLGLITRRWALQY